MVRQEWLRLDFLSAELFSKNVKVFKEVVVKKLDVHSKRGLDTLKLLLLDYLMEDIYKTSELCRCSTVFRSNHSVETINLKWGKTHQGDLPV